MSRSVSEVVDKFAQGVIRRASQMERPRGPASGRQIDQPVLQCVSNVFLFAREDNQPEERIHHLSHEMRTPVAMATASAQCFLDEVQVVQRERRKFDRVVPADHRRVKNLGWLSHFRLVGLTFAAPRSRRAYRL